jgi:hypothetical protein
MFADYKCRSRQKQNNIRFIRRVNTKVAKTTNLPNNHFSNQLRTTYYRSMKIENPRNKIIKKGMRGPLFVNIGSYAQLFIIPLF